MAEPAKNLHDDSDQHLSASERAKRQWGLTSTGEEAKADGASDPSRSKKTARERADERWGMSGDKLKAAEDNGSQATTETSEGEEEKEALGLTRGEEDQFFKDDPKDKKKPKGRFWNRRRALIGGGAGIALGGGIGLFLLFLPALRLEGYMARINEKVFGYAQGAVEQRMGFLLERYLVTRTFASLERCGTKVSFDCAHTYSDAGIAGSLFNKWRDARIEEKLFDKYGMQIEKTNNTAPGSDKFIIRDRFDRQIRLNDGDIQRGRWLTNGRGPGSRELGREINSVLKKETKWYQIMERRSVRKTLKRKYDIKFWCFLACNQRDDLERKYTDAKTRLKYRMTERMVYPFSEKIGLYMDCIISGEAGSGNCSVDKIRERGFENISTADAENIINEFNDSGGDTEANRRSRRLSQIIIEKLAQKILGPTVGRITASGVPVAGQIYAALSIVDMLDRLDSAIKDNTLGKYATDLNSKVYANFYSTFRSSNDELKAHQLSADEVGALHDQFAGAEESKVYQALNGNTAAVESTDESYKCPDGEPIPEGELVCDEKKVVRTFAYEDWRDGMFVDNVAEAINTYDDCFLPSPGGLVRSGEAPIIGTCVGIRPKTIVRPVLEKINWAVEGAVGAALDVVLNTPVIRPFAELIKGLSSDIFEWAIKPLFERIFPLAIQPDSPGRELFDGLFAGGEVLAKDFAAGGYSSEGEYGLGAKRLTPEEDLAIRSEREAQQQYEHENSGLYERVANIENPRSLINKMAMSTPTSPSALVSKLAASIPRSLGRIISSLPFAPAGAQSEDLLAESPFGVPRYGYPVDDPNLFIDPADLTEERCDEIQEEWEDSSYEDDVTGFIEYRTTNPCLLETVAAETGAALFTNEDDGGIGGGTEPGPTEAVISPEGFTFPLLTTKSAIQNPGMFSGGTTNRGGHPYIAYDILVAPGTPVAAFIDGEVTHISEDKCPGRLISIYNQADDVTISYLHLSTSNHVAMGEQVKAGQRIGVVGSEEQGCGVAHLHIDAVTHRPRPSCSRENCPPDNQAKFIDIGRELFEAFQEIPE